MELSNFPKIITVFDPSSGEHPHKYYCEAIKDSLNKILPHQFFDVDINDEDTKSDLKENFQNLLPIVKTVPSDERQETISFFMVSKSRPNAFKFFYEMFSCWVVPGKRLDVAMLFAADFRFPELGDEIYTVCELMINVDDPADLAEIQCNLPIIEMEVTIGAESAYHARRILEVKGLTADEKTAMIQDYVAYFVRRNPERYDRDLFTEMQHVLVICQDEFKQDRDSRLLSRIIGSHYVFRKELLEMVKGSPHKRHLRLRIFRSKVRKNGQLKSVLSVLVGLNFLKEKEIFEEQHLLTAIQNYLPSVKSVKGSFFANRRGTEHICTVYLEIEKADGEEFSGKDIKLLRQELVVDLKDRIGHLMHPVFMPRNEEEIMRNVLTLSNQIKYLRDLPQVNISFDEQTHNDLYFNIILVRVVKPGSESIEEVFKENKSSIGYIHDRCKMLGMLRKKYTKEATVFRLKLPSQAFLRQDHSIDLYKARQFVVDELTRIVGEFRDFNGGMISKQNELLCTVRDLLEEESVRYNDLLLENFFYSLTPVIMRTVLEAKALETLFKMLLKEVNKGMFLGSSYTLEMKQEEKFVYVLVTAVDSDIKDELSKALLKIPRESGSLATSFVRVYDTPCIGYIYRCDDPHSQEQFCRAINLTLKDWDENLSLRTSEKESSHQLTYTDRD
jgi:hypothetical protein